MSTSLAIRKMQIKPTARQHYTPTRMAKMESKKSPNADEAVEKQDHRNVKWYVQPLWKTLGVP